MSTIKSQIIKKRTLLLLAVSLLFFIRKGIQYALLESYIPLLLILLLAGILLYTYTSSQQKGFTLAVKTWSFLLILWAVIRLLLSVINIILEPLNEYHLSKQFGVFGIVLSAAILIVSIFILKDLKNQKHIM